MAPLIQSFRYRPEIDGLRAIAVLAVVLYHAGLGLSGGYIGVDVFFVVSGFLITSLIIKDLQEGRFTFSGFWERRARRIIPAMVVVVVTTLVAGWFLLLPDDYAKLGKSAEFQAIFAANIYFWLHTGYFTGPAAENPLLHTWSLAVEEQFYLFVPMILFGLFRFSSLRKRDPLRLLFIIGIILSLAASIYGVAHRPAAAFYLLPTRAWELLCGCCVALLPAVSLTKSPLLRECLCWIGLFGILVPCWLYTNNTPFPGLAAVPPCIGTSLFIWATGRFDATESPALTLSRLLSARPVVFIGLISYSLYLWHWPLFAFSSYWSLQPMPLAYRLTLVAVAFVLAVISWRFVETPFRKKAFCATREGMLAFAGASITVVLAMGLALAMLKGFPSRVSPEAIRYVDVRNENTFNHELTARDLLAGRVVPIGNRNPSAPIRVLVWGDSHAMAAMPAFDTFLQEKNLAGRQATASATAPIFGEYWFNPFTNPRDVKEFNEAVFAFIKSNSIPDVVIVGFWQYYTDDKGDVPLDAALLSTIERLIGVGARPWIFLQVPHQSFDVPKALALDRIIHRDLVALMAKPTGWNGLRGSGLSIFQKIGAAGGHIIDPQPCFLDETGKHYMIEMSGITLYRDEHHLSVEGARMMLVPLLREVFNLTSEQSRFPSNKQNESSDD